MRIGQERCWARYRPWRDPCDDRTAGRCSRRPARPADGRRGGCSRRTAAGARDSARDFGRATRVFHRRGHHPRECAPQPQRDLPSTQCGLACVHQVGRGPGRDRDQAVVDAGLAGRLARRRPGVAHSARFRTSNRRGASRSGDGNTRQARGNQPRRARADPQPVGRLSRGMAGPACRLRTGDRGAHARCPSRGHRRCGRIPAGQACRGASVP
jgi:hypothetical protein